MTQTPLELADKYINNTGTSVFLTGKAGTGKTTFLRHICQTTNKRCVVVAPTGVAAINANGVTIHSFFQLPFTPFLPSLKNVLSEYSINKQHVRKEKVEIIRTLDLLIIDEISMVRADLLDAIDDRLRRYRRSQRPFGGVQLLMIGDLQQLPPVVKDDEWELMKQVYPSPFFFNSKALQRTPFITIELKTIFRQTDSQFINLLNNIRQNKFDNNTLNLLNTRYQPNFQPDDSEGYIRLTTHNHQAQAINTSKLESITKESYSFEAIIEGNFPEYSYPTDQTLTLKEGAQVMFVRNDSSAEKKYYNGKIATITNISDTNIEVIDREGNTIEVKRDRWENIKYTINKDSKEIEAEVDGSFIQYPLKLAWAITVHKSQGLTFERAIIDVGSAFTYGQVYVALSRCKSFDGLVLSSQITPQCSFSNNDVETFNSNIPSHEYAESNLYNAKSQFFFDNLLELFDFSALQKNINELYSIATFNLSKIYPSQTDELANIQKEITELLVVAERFVGQINKIRLQTNNDTGNKHLHERVNKGCEYFLSQLKPIAERLQPIFGLDIDNKETAKNYNKTSDAIDEIIRIKTATLTASLPMFDVEQYIKSKNTSLLTKEEKNKKKTRTITIVSDNSHTNELVDILKDWRSERSYELDKPPFFVMHQTTLVEIAKAMPQTKEELLDIEGFGKKKYENYGEEILQIISDFCEANNIERRQATIEIDSTTTTKPKEKPNTYLVTLELFRQGKSTEEIAAEREMATSTIEGHLSRFVESGEIDVHSLVGDEELSALVPYFSENIDSLLREAFEHFESKYSYGTLRIVQSYCKYKKDKGS